MAGKKQKQAKPSEPKPEAQPTAQPKAPVTEEGMASFVVVTDRMPVWDGKRQPLHAVIAGRRDDAAIVAMLGRGWIEGAGRGA